MTQQCRRALKEWDAACCAMLDGRQTILIRKGGIREDRGVFSIDDLEFWLMPTFDHQSSDMLQPEYAALVTAFPTGQAKSTVIQAFARVEAIWVATDEEQVNSLNTEMIWNEQYVKLRFDFNPYDPLYILMLRVYRIPKPVVLPMVKAYAGCRSWVTLDRPIDTEELVEVIPCAEFSKRRDAVRVVMG